MGVLPSKLYGITNSIAAFYLDLALSNWASFVDNKVNEVAAAVASTSVGQSRGGDVFIQSARQAQFAKLLGLSEASAYRNPELPGKVSDKPKTNGRQSFSGEGEFDLSKFNG